LWTNITLPKLNKDSSGFVIRNDKLVGIELPALKSVTDAIDFSGTFDT
jgi:hypothetical protein